MLRRTIAGSALLAVAAAPLAPAAAQHGSDFGFEGRRGVHATVNLRVPLGGRTAAERPTLGLTVGYDQSLAGPDGRRAVRELRLADLRLDGGGTTQFRLAGFELAGADRARTLSVYGNKKNVLLLTLMFAAGAAMLAGVISVMKDEDGLYEPYDPPPEVPLPPDGE